LKNKDYYTKLIEIFRNKGIYDNIVWSYAFMHHDEQGIKEYFRKLQRFNDL